MTANATVVRVGPRPTKILEQAMADMSEFGACIVTGALDAEMLERSMPPFTELR
jgi:hypothetical protein